MVSDDQVFHDAEIPSMPPGFEAPRSSPMADSTNSHVHNSVNFNLEDPLQLNHSDHPNYVLSTRLLNQHNFNHWKRCVEISLLAKNKLVFVNGDLPRPLDPILASKWDRCNGMVISWLLHSVEKDIAQSIIYCDTAEQIWQQL